MPYTAAKAAAQAAATRAADAAFLSTAAIAAAAALRRKEGPPNADDRGARRVYLGWRQRGDGDCFDGAGAHQAEGEGGRRRREEADKEWQVLIKMRTQSGGKNEEFP